MPIVATLVAGPAIRNTSAVPAGMPAAISDAAIGTDAVVQTYSGTAIASTSSMPPMPWVQPIVSRAPTGTSVVISAASRMPTISHRSIAPRMSNSA